MSIEVSNLDHLGLVAGILDEMGIEAEVNRRLGEEVGEKISAGKVVKAMILNGLGFVSSPLYLFSRFFEGKAVEHLLGAGVKAEYLNDDKMGRVMDRIYQFGVNELFVLISLKARQHYEVSTKIGHLDSTSFHVHGDYNYPEQPGRIKITYGYSRDRRPDLKQFMMDLMCTGDGGVPVWMRIGDGNESDGEQFVEAMKKFQSQLNWESLIVMDAAFYSQENIQEVGEMKWLSRVPLTLKAAKKLVKETDSASLTLSEQPGYSYKQVKSNYGGVEQRWLLVESQKRRDADLEKLEKNLKKQELECQKKLRTLSQKEFACSEDAQREARRLLKKSKFHQLNHIHIQKVEGKTGELGYQVTGKIEVDEEKVNPERQQAGRFFLATNVLSLTELSSEEMLCEYKNQQQVERGFGFLKDPLFLTDSVFLKSPERIEVLGCIMGLCLLVYTLAQRELRQTLKRRESQIKNQLGAPTSRPTLRWIFQCFQSIHCVGNEGVKQITNLTEERLNLLKFFPSACQRYYLLP